MAVVVGAGVHVQLHEEETRVTDVEIRREEPGEARGYGSEARRVMVSMMSSNQSPATSLASLSDAR
jgi:hypothetical protein